MSSVSVDDLMAFNDQLVALRRAGVPLDFGLSRPSDDAASLERFNTAVVRHISRGEPMDQAVRASTQSASQSYLGKLLVGLREGRLPSVLDGAARVAALSERSGSDLKIAFAYPLLLALLSCVGLMGFCVLLAPTFASTYEDLREAPGQGARLLLWSRDHIAYWGVAAALLLLTVWLWIRRAKARPTRAVANQRWAEYAGAAADLLEAGVPLEEAFHLAADACGDSSLAETDPTPPLLAWATGPQYSLADQSLALRAVASVYGHSAERRAERFGRVAPIVATAAIGGAFALAYGLALFVPVIELLLTLAKP
ncbi:type IV pilin biogenesis protein [Pirellulimonas nuda]|uniref:Type IV pilin biogenesis protein n=1 Tax=Pirellulimonas nuda TaxID=2528009 RepID=A0A518DCG6_9BACT|nr:type II secretion system F family protein [Pirellulimonas nuda]QDU89177.1 type IV pilin biogenesis protein [Pirellulimonas nuda]